MRTVSREAPWPDPEGSSLMSDLRITHIGGPTTLIETGDRRLLTDPTFAPPGERPSFGWGTSSHKSTGLASDPPPIDAVLLSHDQHDDNLDRTGCDVLRTARTVRRPRPEPAGSAHRPAASPRGPLPACTPRGAPSSTSPPLRPPRPTPVPAADRTGHGLRPHRGRLAARCAADLRGHRPVRRRTRGGPVPDRRHRAAARRRLALPDHRTGPLHRDRRPGREPVPPAVPPHRQSRPLRRPAPLPRGPRHLRARTRPRARGQPQPLRTSAPEFQRAPCGFC